MNKKQAIQINRLKENLSDIRKIAGWTGEELGNMIGVTRQAISKLEKNGTMGSSQMSLAQYIAIRHLLDYYVLIKPENKTLFKVMKLLLDDYTILGAGYVKLRGCVNTIAELAVSGVKGKELDAIAESLMDESIPIIREESKRALDISIYAKDDIFIEDMQDMSWTERIIKNSIYKGENNEKR